MLGKDALLRRDCWRLTTLLGLNTKGLSNQTAINSSQCSYNKDPIRFPFHSKLGPHLINLGLHSMWEQC